LSVDKEQIGMMTTGAVQELYQIVQRQAAVIAEQQQRLDRLERLMSQLVQ
jgi:hypothetical protein